MIWSFHPEGEAELNQAVGWYESKQPGLGFDFATEAYDAVARAVAFPQAWPAIAPGVRRCLVKRFSYGILSAKEGRGLLVLAIMHLHRRPDYWRSRR